MKRLVSFAVLLATLALLAACHAGGGEGGGGGRSDSVSRADSVLAHFDVERNVAQPPFAPDSAQVLTQQQADSLAFRLTHHYSENYNFVVTADSLTLVPRMGDLIGDTCRVRCGDLLVVAQIKAQPSPDSVGADTVWVKVARDQLTMGWIEETELIRGTVPDEQISRILYVLTGSRMVWMSVVVALGLVGFLVRRAVGTRLHIVRFDEMPSFYPPLLLVLVASLATLYASIQNFVPEFWQEYYYHPTLNPFVLPPVMAALVVLVWLIAVVSGAVLIEVYHTFYFIRGVSYLLEMCSLVVLVYLVMSWATFAYIGYVLLPLFVAVVVAVYFRRIRCTLTCGKCGRKLRCRGVCPHCGAVNE